MNWTPNREAVEAELEELAVASTSDTRRLLTLLATEPHAVYTSLSRLGELHVPDESEIPAVDALVAAELERAFLECTEPSVLRKTKPMGAQCKRLLSVLLRDVGSPVALPELLLANGLRSGTPRRLRELQREHGAFAIATRSIGGVQHYILERPEPDLTACARFWVLANLRNGLLPPERRVLAILSAELGRRVPRRDLDYVLPAEESPGRGQARPAGGLTDDAVAVLRERGYDIDEGSRGFVLNEL